MLWVKAFHVITMTTWFAALFYLPRLFVYHAMSDDETSNERFKIMERKLFFGLVIYHIYCGKLLKDFKFDRNQKSHVYYRWFNEFPVLLLIAIIILVIIRPG